MPVWSCRIRAEYTRWLHLHSATSRSVFWKWNYQAGILKLLRIHWGNWIGEFRVHDPELSPILLQVSCLFSDSCDVLRIACFSIWIIQVMSPQFSFLRKYPEVVWPVACNDTAERLLPVVSVQKPQLIIETGWPSGAYFALSKPY